MYERIKRLYIMGRLTESAVKDKVKEGAITQKQCNAILKCKVED